MGAILLIGPSFFGYRDRVAKEMGRHGHDVEVVDDRPSESVAFRSLAKVAAALTAKSIARYTEVLRQRIGSGSYDHVIYMGGMTFLFERSQVELMRFSAPSAKFTAYLWDSLSNSPKLAKSLDLFDRVLSFEPRDCESRGLELRPLFYSDVCARLPLEPDNGFAYDACFVGSVHQPRKFEAVKRICDVLEEKGLRVFKYYYMPSRSVAALRKTTVSMYRREEFFFEPLAADQVADIYANSAAIIDSPQSLQRGLTMRTLEAVGARRKLITTNPDVANYDIFSEDNVAVWDGERGISPGFFMSPYCALPKDVYASYSIESFVASLVGEGAAFAGYSEGGSRQ